MAIHNARQEAGWRILLIASILAVSWLGMQIVHEAGHVVAAWATGGRVLRVELTPWTLSRTDVFPNPRPLAVAWGGPIVGTAVPVLIWLGARRLQLTTTYLWRFFAGFCLLANGAYLGSGVVHAVGDAADILGLSSQAPLLGAFGAVAVPAGLALWHQLGARFGFGESPPPVHRGHAVGCTALLLAIGTVEIAL